MEVTPADGPARPQVSPACCSALPRAYIAIAPAVWKPFARLVLEAAFEAALRAGAEQHRHGGSAACTRRCGRSNSAGRETRYPRPDAEPELSMHYLNFDLAEVADGVCALDAMASTAAAQHPAVMAEVRQVLDWAWREFPDTHGPIDDGMAWDHDLQVTIEDGGWHRVTLTLTGTGTFVDEFLAVFGSAAD